VGSSTSHNFLGLHRPVTGIALLFFNLVDRITWPALRLKEWFWRAARDGGEEQRMGVSQAVLPKY
jgi:hypothetical protein